MIHYLDTSALVKRYVSEPGSASVRELFARRRSIAVCRIAYAELAAAIARYSREGGIDEVARDELFARLDRDFAAMTVREVKARWLKTIPALVTRAALRGFDAVHLAAALSLRDDGLPVTFWTSDQRLAHAATSEGLRATSLPVV